jgi:hypothetical protein
MTRPFRGFALVVTLLLAGTAAGRPAAQAPATAPAPVAAAAARGGVTSPVQEWQHQIGDDYFLVNYQQMAAYWRKLERESSRVRVVDIGRTSRDRPHLMAIITSPANHKRLDRYREISARLSRADGLTDAQARALAREGKAIVWIDGGLHATETLGAQQLIELVYQMTSGTDEETLRILDDVVLLAVAANPDGMDLVSDWYMAHGSMNIPVLYNHYAGHDDNRDFYMSALAESTNMNRVMYREWYPQIMYNHHQSGPQGTVMFAPPFRDPFNYNFHPYIPAAIDLVGAAMATRFIAEGKPGVTQRGGSNYSTWWNGGLRTTAYFHNQIGILTETIGNPTPMSIPFVRSRQIGDSNLFWPIPPQPVWRMRQSIEYSMTANRAILDFASRYRETVLFNIYQMGRDAIRWGNEDHWTFTPHETTAIEASARGAGAAGRGAGGGRGGGAADPLYAAMRAPERRDPRGFILPASQPDFGTATRFVNALIKTGVDVHRATAAFTVAGKSYPAGSYVVKAAQAFRPHVMDMFEPQDHPDDIPYPGASPTPPYDNAGYTLAFQMGVQFDRILDAFDGPFAKLPDFARVPPGTIAAAQGAAGYYFTHQANNSFIVINRLLKAKEDVYWLRTGPFGDGTFYVAGRPTTRGLLEKAAVELGVSFQGTATAPAGLAAATPAAGQGAAVASKLRLPRIGLYDQYGGSMPSGWTRLILEQFEFPYEVVFAPMLDAGGLRDKYDVLVFNGGGLPAVAAGGRGGRGGGAGQAAPAPTAPAAGRGGGDTPDDGGQTGGRARGAGQTGAGGAASGRANFTPQPIPEEYRRRQGGVTAKTMQEIRAFVEAGGALVGIGSAAMSAALQFGLPVSNQLAGIGRQDYYVPASVLRVAVDPTQPLAHGLSSEVDVLFNNNPVFKLGDDAAARGVQRVAWFADGAPLRSGWAWGAKHLDQGTQAIDASVGAGRLYLFAPEILFRSQPHGTFKFFFNALLLSAAR